MKIYIADFKNPEDKIIYKKGKKWGHVLHDFLPDGYSEGEKFELTYNDDILEKSKLLKTHEIVKYKLQGIIK